MKKSEPTTKSIVVLIIFVILSILSFELIEFFESNIVVYKKEIQIDNFYSLLEERFNNFSTYELTIGINDCKSYVKQFSGNFIQGDKTIIAVKYSIGDKRIQLLNLGNQEENQYYYLEYASFLDIKRAIECIGQNEAKSIDLKTIKEINISNDISDTISFYNKYIKDSINIDKGWYVDITYVNGTSHAYIINQEYNKIYSLR